MRHCIFVLGTRAQLVKVAPVLNLAQENGLLHSVWFTGQHHESIDDLIEDFGIESKFVLPENRIERSSVWKLFVWIPKTIYGCYRYVKGIRADTEEIPLVIVHGDTLSAWLGAVAANWGGGAVVHLESGLSSGKWSDPFPEEILRRLTFREARYAFCPNEDAAQRMHKYPNCIVTNIKQNTLLDCVRFAMQRRAPIGKISDYFVASIHRFQNIYKRDRLTEIVDELLVAAEFGEMHFILHPPTEIRLKKYNLFDLLANSTAIHMRPRMPYTKFLALLSGARAVFSDGGSNQEELSYLGVPTLLFRRRSERPDGLGRNIRLRAEVDESLRNFIESGRLDALRTPSRIDDDVMPSKMTHDALAKWSGLRKLPLNGV